MRISMVQASSPTDNQKQQHHSSKSAANSAPSRSQLPPRQASQPPLRDPAVAAQLAAVAEARGKQAEGRGKGKKPLPGRLPDARREQSHVPPSFQTTGAYVAPGRQPGLMQRCSRCVQKDRFWHTGPEPVILSATAQGWLPAWELVTYGPVPPIRWCVAAKTAPRSAAG